jgi:hypothetical protein
MTEAKIFLVDENQNALSPMTETSYEAEEVLQALIAQYPDLIPGEQINPESPRKWMLVGRELAVPFDFDEAGRLSLDHLFLDQDGIPTFVECKRASDTRIRREVVAQMLDYAANGTEYWSVDHLRQTAAETAKDGGQQLDELMNELINSQDEEDIESYWQRVEDNLHTGKVRLIFAADSTPKELRRLVEFLNDKMNDVEVLIVEVKQFLSAAGQKAIVPRVIGITEAARGKIDTTTPRNIDKNEFLSTCIPTVRPFFEKIIQLAAEKGHSFYWGTKGFSIRAYLPKNDRLVSFVYGYPPNLFQFYFGHFPLPEDESLKLRKELLAFGLFKESGKKTLAVNLRETDLAKAYEVYEFILNKMDQIIENY